MLFKALSYKGLVEKGKQAKGGQNSKQRFTIIIESITRSFIMLNTMMENENTSFANILIPFLRSCCEHALNMISGKGSEY